jgi:Putative adhesin
MGSYPPPPYPPPPPGPPYGNDWKYQRRVLKDQARAQRDMIRAQREAYRYQARSTRRSSILGPLILITLGVIFLLVQSGHLQGYRLWEWYGRFWPFLLVGAGVVMLLEWAYDQYVQSDSTQPRYRRRVGGGIVTVLIILAFTGVIFSNIRAGGHSKMFDGLSINQDNIDEFLGDKHESDQTLAQSFPAGATLNIGNPRGDVTISGTSDDNQIHVTVHKEVYTRSDSEADTKADRLSPTIGVNGNNVSLMIAAIDGARTDLTITVPANASPSVTANHGDVKITAVKGGVVVTANHGDIELSAITGDITTHINNGNSDLSAHSVTGTISIEGRAHDTTLSDLSGPVTMRGEFFGDTHMEHIRGPIKFHTSRTDFQLGRLDGEINIGNNAELTASNAVGPVTLTTYSRNITLDRVSGDIYVTNRNGSVDVTSAPPLSNITVENRNGSVDVTVPEQGNFAYQFDANNGSIESEFAEIQIPEGGLQKKTIGGVVGKGGPMIRVTTSQGDIALKKASILPLPPTPPTPPRLTMVPPTMPAEATQAIREATAQARQAAKQAAAEAKKAAAEAQKSVKEANKQIKPDDQ